MRTWIPFLLLLLMLPAVGLAQSGWTRARKGLFLKTDISFFSAKNYYNGNGNLLVTNRFNQFNLSFYGEYGLRDRLTLIAQAPLLRLNKYETTRSVIGQGDLQLHLKYRFTGNKLPVAVSFGADMPTGRANASAEDKALPGVFINLPTGDGEFNFWTTLAASKSFGKFYATLYGSYDLRTTYDGKRFRDLVQFGGELGYHPVPKLWINAKLRTQLSLGQSQHPELSFIRGDASEFMMISAEAFYKPYKHWGFSANVLSANNLLVPYRNVYAAPMVSVGIAFEK